jgi:hypothetical protein
MTTARPIPSARRRGHALAGMAIACALILLAACGGGGGGGGDAAFKLRLAITNETAEPANVTLAVDEVPGEPQPLESCKAALFELDIPADPGTWTVSINDQVAIDSTQLDPNLIDKNLIGSARLNEDGSVEILEEIQPGALISPPAASGICL